MAGGPGEHEKMVQLLHKKRERDEILLPHAEQRIPLFQVSDHLVRIINSETKNTIPPAHESARNPIRSRKQTDNSTIPVEHSISFITHQVRTQVPDPRPPVVARLDDSLEAGEERKTLTHWGDPV
jgi:hypothetical protein